MEDSSFWVCVMQFVLYSLASSLMIVCLKYSIRSGINRNRAVAKAILLRRAYALMRILVVALLVLIGFILIVKTLASSVHTHTTPYIKFSIMIGECAMFVHILSAMSLPINFLMKHDVLKNGNRFVLYLRGFNSDNYTPKLEEIGDKISKMRHPGSNVKSEVQDPNEQPLNERNLNKAWRRFMPIYGVGSPEELESPEGCKRIYLSNSTWQDDVVELIKAAKYVVVRVNSNDNCIWEIAQCNELASDKTIYYIEDPHILYDMRNKMKDETPICLKTLLPKYKHICVYSKNGEMHEVSYDNDYIGLTELTHHITS